MHDKPHQARGEAVGPRCDLGPTCCIPGKKRGSEPAPGFHAKRAVMNPTASPPLFPARIEVVNPKRRDSVPFPAPGSLPRFLQDLYQRFLRRLFLGFTTRVHYLNSCKNRGKGSLPQFLQDARRRRHKAHSAFERRRAQRFAWRLKQNRAGPRTGPAKGVRAPEGH